MAPKRAKVVRTTKKVVEETIEILGVACDSHESVDLPAASDSKMVEVLVEAKEGKVPIAVVVAKDKKDESETEHKQRADEGSPETEQPQQKRDGDAELVSEQRAKEKKIEPGTEQKKRANEASRETEEPLPQQKGEDDDHSKRKEEAESIADMETQEEEEEEEEEGEEEREEKGEEDERVEKEAEPPTPKKVEQRKEVPMKESKKGGKQRRRRRRKRRLAGGELDGAGGGYKRYVFRVLRQVHPGLGISARAMAVVDGMMGDMFERLADEASRLSTYAGKATLSTREVQGAVQLVLPGELGKHAIAEGSKAVANYMAAASGGGD